ncbi:M48 family metalloprotease [Pusillimonas sp. TS35]|uniref:M48 family metallopeptidase n=1 Tax=Paracandidimonas lactea TaxID=2895524 RepID=UPI0013720FBB|nr:M48 family metallopeptidase [Paracandidimonas lactea]MYN11994.1 M48 family metalloprotease [Pusillimonas sp. TS35]
MNSNTSRIRRLCTVGALCAATLLAACSAVQTTGSGAVGVERKQYMSGLVSEAALQQEAAQQYTSLVSKARSQGALDVNAAETARVNKIVQRLIQQVGVFRPDARGWNWEVHVLNSDEVNAWCMPGGKIAVYTGLIKQIKPSDAELAAVIGHEMAHALREHTREQVSREMASNLGLSVLSAVTGTSAVGDLGGALNKVMFSLPNSRTAESEADQIGVELAARAGYDPRAAVTLWQKMNALGGAGQPEFLSTHPSASTRIAELQKASEKVMPLYQQSAKAG